MQTDLPFWYDAFIGIDSFVYAGHLFIFFEFVDGNSRKRGNIIELIAINSAVFCEGVDFLHFAAAVVTFWQEHFLEGTFIGQYLPIKMNRFH